MERGNRYSIQVSRRGTVKLSPFVCACVLLLPVATMTSRAQDQVAVDPGIAKVEFENDQVRVLRVSYAGYQKSHLHSHPSRIVVTLTKSESRASFPDGKSQTSQRTAGDLFWSEPITHQIENLSGDPVMNIEVELKQSKSHGETVKPAATPSTAQGTESDPVPVEQEPHHRVVFENQYVRVLDVVVKPGETTLFHKHSLDNVAVILAGTTLRNQVPGQDWTERAAKDRSVGFASGTAKSYVHRISNAGATVFHVLDIQILP
jgi:quercetin dioxygenase-like cupin family protein